jgi:hypothetical protein
MKNLKLPPAATDCGSLLLLSMARVVAPGDDSIIPINQSFLMRAKAQIKFIIKYKIIIIIAAGTVVQVYIYMIIAIICDCC